MTADKTIESNQSDSRRPIYMLNPFAEKVDSKCRKVEISVMIFLLRPSRIDNSTMPIRCWESRFGAWMALEGNMVKLRSIFGPEFHTSENLCVRLAG